ncbi:MAG: heme-binding domain-containing protein [Lutibacter sp.]|nr:heme-binding domain-containing protein [Lutibacter sp.]
MIVFVGIQFIPTNRNQSDEILESDFSKTFNVPSNIQNLFKKSCYDCHSNNTSYPWYNKIQPASWFLEKHIKEGKEELNFSEFGAYSKRKQKSKLKSIISQIRDDEMPMLSYTLIHGDAKLSTNEKQLIIEWVDKLRDSL